MSESPNNKCVFPGFGGNSHPHSFCIAPPSEIIPECTDPDRLGTKCMSEALGGTLTYVKGLITDPGKAVSANCGHVIGTKYVLETNGKCILDGKEVTRHKYIDNSCDNRAITGDENSNAGCGFIPAALGSATKINGLGLFKAFIGDATPPCVQVKLKCHVLNKTNTSSQYDLYEGDSGLVNIPEDELGDINNSDIEYGPTRAGFSNINDSLNEFINNYKGYSVVPNIDKKKERANIDNNADNDLSGDNAINNTYYLLLSIFLIFVTYKVMIKK